MNPTEFSERLLQTEPGSPEAAALARDLVEEARYPANFVLHRRLTLPDSADDARAKHVLAELGELALAPLAQSAFGQEMDTELWAMRTMTEELVAFRRRSASVLRNLLSNRHRAAPMLQGSPISGHPPGSRVCDLAFVMLRRLLHLGSPPSAFLEPPPKDRDQQIKALEESREFRAAFEGQP